MRNFFPVRHATSLRWKFISVNPRSSAIKWIPRFGFEIRGNQKGAKIFSSRLVCRALS
jgi:hypothetical protein